MTLELGEREYYIPYVLFRLIVFQYHNGRTHNGAADDETVAEVFNIETVSISIIFITVLMIC